MADPDFKSVYETARTAGFNYVIGKLQDRMDILAAEKARRDAEIEELMRSLMENQSDPDFLEKLKGQKQEEKSEPTEEEITETLRQQIEPTVDMDYFSSALKHLKTEHGLSDNRRQKTYDASKVGKFSPNREENAKKSAHVQGLVAAHDEIMGMIDIIAGAMKDGYAELEKGPIKAGFSSKKQMGRIVVKLSCDRVDHLWQNTQGITGLTKDKIPAWTRDADTARKPKPPGFDF